MTVFQPARLLKLILCAAVATLSLGLSAQTLETRASHNFKSQPIPGRYIVVFKDGVTDETAVVESDKAVRKSGGRKLRSYSRSFKGFAATLSEATAQELRNDPLVEIVEQDQTVSIQQLQSPATWGLDRIDQVDRPLDGLYHYDYTGAGVNVFIIDTGIRGTHSEFGDRVLAGFNTAVENVADVVNPNNTNDCNGHGTHVAGTVGGATWGVANQVSLIPVRVLNCKGSGSWSGVIEGINWVANSARRPAVANMSLGGDLSAAVNAAVAAAVANGVTMVVAAGNGNTNACKSSPASEPSAITVGASTRDDTRATAFSNFGTCVDIFAPGVDITSAWNTSNSATNTISGTSMASPHVTGVAALALQANPTATPAAIALFLKDRASTNKLSSIGTGSPNLLLYSVGAGVPTEPPVPAIAVKSLVGKVVKVQRDWRAQVTVTLRHLEGTAPVPGATVSGTFSPGGSASCVSTSNSSCIISSGIIIAATTSTVFTVTNVTAANKAYDSTQNSASQITINNVSTRR